MTNQLPNPKPKTIIVKDPQHGVDPEMIRVLGDAYNPPKPGNSGIDWFVAYCLGTAIFAIIAFVLEILLT